MMRKLVILILGLCTLPIHAAWFELTGIAPILPNAKYANHARQEALLNAVYQVISQHNGQYSGMKQIKPLLYTPQMQYSVRDGEIRRIHVLEEQIRNGQYWVRTKIEFVPQPSACAAQYRKNLLIAEPKLSNTAIAKHGQWYALPTAFGRLLSQRFKKDSLSFLTNTKQPLLPQLSAEGLRYYLDDHNAEWLLKTVITDLSQQGNQRFFSFKATLMDGVSGEVHWESQYRIQGDWINGHKPEPNTPAFWRTDYGQAIQSLSQNLLVDLETEMQCQLTRPKITQIQEGHITINIGRNNGVKSGDTLTLWHENGHFSNDSKHFLPDGLPSPMEFTVKRVSSYYANLIPNQPEYLLSARIGDFLIKQE